MQLKSGTSVEQRTSNFSCPLPLLYTSIKQIMYFECNKQRYSAMQANCAVLQCCRKSNKNKQSREKSTYRRPATCTTHVCGGAGVRHSDVVCRTCLEQKQNMKTNHHEIPSISGQIYENQRQHMQQVSNTICSEQPDFSAQQTTTKTKGTLSSFTKLLSPISPIPITTTTNARSAILNHLKLILNYCNNKHKKQQRCVELVSSEQIANNSEGKTTIRSGKTGTRSSNVDNKASAALATNVSKDCAEGVLVKCKRLSLSFREGVAHLVNCTQFFFILMMLLSFLHPVNSQQIVGIPSVQSHDRHDPSHFVFKMNVQNSKAVNNYDESISLIQPQGEIVANARITVEHKRIATNTKVIDHGTQSVVLPPHISLEETQKSYRANHIDNIISVEHAIVANKLNPQSNAIPNHMAVWNALPQRVKQTETGIAVRESHAVSASDKPNVDHAVDDDHKANEPLPPTPPPKQLISGADNQKLLKLVMNGLGLQQLPDMRKVS